MKRALIYLLIFVAIQLGTAFAVLIPYSIYLVAHGKDIIEIQSPEALSFVLIISNLLTIFVFYHKFKVGQERLAWSLVSVKYMILSTLIVFPFIWLPTLMATYLDIPDVSDLDITGFAKNWCGTLAIAVIGPITEEIIFRGGITRALLQRYNPRVAILISGFIFGMIHFNPAQAFGAFFTGILLGWMYYKTASLLPCIWLHIVNNSLAVYMIYNYPHVDNLEQWIGNSSLFQGITILAIMILPAILYLMSRARVRYAWRDEYK